MANFAMRTQYVQPCFGTKKNGKRAGYRHRWVNGVCRFCHRFRSDCYHGRRQ